METLLSIRSWVEGIGVSVLVSFVMGILATKGWSLIIREFAGKASVVLKEISEAALSGSQFWTVVNRSIKDNGKLKENSLEELKQAGKEVIAELQDVVVVIKPKKKKAL